jgi:hypothetical protein
MAALLQGGPNHPERKFLVASAAGKGNRMIQAMFEATRHIACSLILTMCSLVENVQPQHFKDLQPQAYHIADDPTIPVRIQGSLSRLSLPMMAKRVMLPRGIFGFRSASLARPAPAMYRGGIVCNPPTLASSYTVGSRRLSWWSKLAPGL